MTPLLEYVGLALGLNFDTIWRRSISFKFWHIMAEKR